MFKYALNKKKTSYTTKMSFKHTGKMSIVLKGVTRDFSQKFENASQSHFL